MFFSVLRICDGIRIGGLVILKNLKCIIGASIGTPIVFSLFIVFIVGVLYLMDRFPTVSTIVGISLLVGVLAIIWFVIYTGCVERHNEKHN